MHKRTPKGALNPPKLGPAAQTLSQLARESYLLKAFQVISCIARDEYSFHEGPRDGASEELAEDIVCPLPLWAKVPSSSLPFHEFSIFSWVIFTIILTSGNFSNSK